MDLRWILRRLLEGERYNFLAESYHQRRHQRLMIESVDGQFIKCLWFKICAFKMGSINDISSLIGAIKSCFVIPFGKVNDIWTDEQANLWTLDSLQSTPSYSEPVEAIYEEETLSEKSHALKAWLFVFFCAFACCCTNGTCIKKQNSLSASFCARAIAVPTTQKKLQTVWTGGVWMKSQMASTCLRTQQIFVTLTVEEGERFEVGVYCLSIGFLPTFEMLLCTFRIISNNRRIVFTAHFGKGQKFVVEQKYLHQSKQREKSAKQN